MNYATTLAASAFSLVLVASVSRARNCHGDDRPDCPILHDLEAGN